MILLTPIFCPAYVSDSQYLLHLDPLHIARLVAHPSTLPHILPLLHLPPPRHPHRPLQYNTITNAGDLSIYCRVPPSQGLQVMVA